ncbi:MAG: biotin/lipoyl-binding protein [Woeseiaceae bacterium]|nr:biotin/lipoyl-binding protein [Woeseiaceae bacterium]
MTARFETPGAALRPLLPVGLLAALLAGCGVGEARLEHAEPATASPLPVVAVSSQVSDLFATYHATSTITADGEAQVPARVGGEVVELHVEEGDRVVQGQILARLDGARLKLKMLATKAEFARQQNEFDRMQKLHERGLISSAAFESLQFEVEALRAAHELDRLNHDYTTIRAPSNGCRCRPARSILVSMCNPAS